MMMMSSEDDDMSVCTSTTTASLTPSIASYMSSWSMPVVPSRGISGAKPAKGNSSSSRRRGRGRGRYGHRAAAADDNDAHGDAAGTTFHSRRLRGSSTRRPRLRDVEEGGSSCSPLQQQDSAQCIGHNNCRMMIRARRVIPGILAFVATVVLFSTHPAPTYYRRLICDVVFDYSGYAGYYNWEDLFSPTSQAIQQVYQYAIAGGNGPSLPPKTDIAFVLTVTECPEDVLPDSNMARYEHQDPARAFYDAAAMLRYLVCTECKELNYASKYTHDFVAIVHPAAQYCTDSRDGKGTYDRVKVLEQLGYRVEIKGSPVWEEVVEDPYLQANAPLDMGFRDLMKLHAYTLTRHQVVVMVDFTTIILDPIDDVIDEMLESDQIKASFAYEYATESPALELQRGINTNLLLIKPSYSEYNTLVQLYRTETYNETMGWGGHGVGNFVGALGTSGLLTHYYRSNPDTYIELDKCTYANVVEDPEEESTGYCRDGSEPPCEDCRLKSINSVKAGRLNRVCGRPWECPWSGEPEVVGTWDGPTEQLCTAFLTEWYTKRLQFEENHWTGPTSNRTGTFHPDVFLGFCRGPGVVNYEQIIEDQPLPPTSSPTISPTSSPTVSPTASPTPVLTTTSPSPGPVTPSPTSLAAAPEPETA